MRQLQRTAAGLVAALAALVVTAGCASAQARPKGPDAAGQDENAYEKQAPQGTQATQGKEAIPGKEKEVTPGEKTQPDVGENPYGSTPPRALGAGIGGQGTPFVLGPLETKGLGAGIGCEQGKGTEAEGTIRGPAPAPVPQYWLADASLFAANAGNAAQTLAKEQGLLVQAPGVLSNQAQFMIAATDRAITSLASLQAGAEVASPGTVSALRDAVNQLRAARGQETLALESADAGTLGPGDEGTVRAAYEHLQAAERDMTRAGRAYGAHGFTLSGAPAFGWGRGFGAGIGPKCAPCAEKAPAGEKAPPGVQKAPEPLPSAPTPAPESPAPEKP